MHKVSSTEFASPFIREQKALEDRVAGARDAFVTELDGYGSELDRIERDWKKLLASWKSKKLDDGAFVSKGKVIEQRVKAAAERRETADRHREALIAAQAEMLGSYRKQEADMHDKMRGLCSYLLHSGRGTAAIQYLHDELCSYRDSNDPKERAGISQSISSIFASATEFNSADQVPTVLHDYEQIQDAEQKSAFYKAHREQIHAVFNQQQGRNIDESSNPTP